jgi:hypothetical protein
MDVLDQLHLAHWADASERLRLIPLAIDEIERLRKENAELKELLQATVDYTGAVASSPNISFYPSPKWHLVTNGAIQEITIGKTTGGE